MFLIRREIPRTTPKLVYPGVSSKGKWSSWISIPESSKLLKEQPVSRLFMQTTTTVLSRLKCDIKLHHSETQKEISFSFSPQGCCVLKPTHQKKHCRTLQSFRKLNVCLWKFDMPVCPAYSSFSSIFYLPGIFSRRPPLPTYSAFLSMLLPHSSTDHCFAFNSS